METHLRSLSVRELTRLAQVFTLDLRYCMCSTIYDRGFWLTQMSTQITIHVAQRQPLALERDRHYRVVSQEGQPAVARIIPYYFGRHLGGLEAAMPNIF